MYQHNQQQLPYLEILETSFMIRNKKNSSYKPYNIKIWIFIDKGMVQ
jgi:hypothetical protein